jgi:RimJ/RimL family protein N-acetyltransferase
MIATTMIETSMITTPRLILREWCDADLADLAAMNADPQVMRYFGKTMTVAESADMLDRLRGWSTDYGVTFWRVSRAADDGFLGMAGLKPLTVPWPVASDFEIGWRFAQPAWGHGYASEAAAAAMASGLQRWPRIIAMTVAANRPSWRVMERIGMARTPALDFDHPMLAVDHELRPHIVYTKTA